MSVLEELVVAEKFCRISWLTITFDPSIEFGICSSERLRLSKCQTTERSPGNELSLSDNMYTKEGS